MTGAARAMYEAAQAFERAPAKLARVGADALAEGIEREMRRDVGGDGRMSNLDRGSGSLTVDVGSDEATLEAHGAMWVILEDGTKAHTVKAQSGRSSGRAARALRIDGSWRSGPVRVRGVRPKHTFSRGVKVSAEDAFKAQRQEWAKING